MDKEKLFSKIRRGIIWMGAAPRNSWTDNLIRAHYTTPTMEAIQKVIHSSLLDSCIIVVENQAIEKWCGLLETNCLRYGRDYLDEIAARYLLSAMSNNAPSRKLAVFYGNCQMHDYFDALRMSPAFLIHYEAVYFKYLEYPRWKEDRLELLLELCDLLVYIKEGFDERFRNCKKYVTYHNPCCQTIQIPTYCFRGYFPQTNPHIQDKGEYDIVAETFNSYHREDQFINSLIKQGLTEDKIVEKVLSGNCFSTQQICKEIAIASRLLEAMDRVSDVKIADFVKANYQSVRLFKDPVHMENITVWYVCAQILEILGFQQTDPVPQKTIHYFTELPIYPEVVNALNLQWPNHMYLPEIRLAQGMIQVTMLEFVRRYCRFAHNAHEIKSSLQIQADKYPVKEWFPGYEP